MTLTVNRLNKSFEIDNSNFEIVLVLPRPRNFRVVDLFTHV